MDDNQGTVKAKISIKKSPHSPGTRKLLLTAELSKDKIVLLT